MKNNYRGDTFWRSYEVDYDDKAYIFQEGDILKVAFYDFSGKEFLPQKIVVNSETEKVDVMWQKEEMATLKRGQYVLEVEITTKMFRKTYQELLDISEDYIVSDLGGEE